MLCPNGHSLFNNEIPNFESCTPMGVPKRLFVFLTEKYKVLQLHPNGHSFFYRKIQNLELYSNGHSFYYNFQRNREFWKSYPNRHSYFPRGNTRSNYLSSIYFRFLKTEKKKKDFEISCFLFLQWKTKLETLLNFELHFIHKKGYKNMY